MISLKVWSRWLAFRICSDWEVSRSLLWRHQMSQRKAWSLLTNQRSTKKCFSIVLDSRNTKLNNISFHFYNNLKWLSHFLAFSSNSNLKKSYYFQRTKKSISLQRCLTVLLSLKEDSYFCKSNIETRKERPSKAFFTILLTDWLRKPFDTSPRNMAKAVTRHVSIIHSLNWLFFAPLDWKKL